MGERFGNYEILRRLAQGGMAEVLLAKHEGLGGFERLVCLKRILPHLSGQEEFLKMFQDEARIAANLLHPNVAQIYDIGVHGEHYYIAMEYVRGEDLRRVYNQEVTRGRSMPQHVAALIVMGAAAGLHYAHRQTALDGTPLEIVHRDVSPQNILVTYDGHVKLIDFGVAKAAGKLNQTRAGVLKGKYSYMSPEQAAGDPVDARTDIFALGTTLYEITTGTRLFKRDNELETLHAVIACSVPKPSVVVPGYDLELEAIVLRALAYDAGSRYQSAAELERDLEGYLRAQRHPTSAPSLAAYMQALFADKLAEQAALLEPSSSVRSAPAPAQAPAPEPERRPTPDTVVPAPPQLEDEATVATPVAASPLGDDEATTIDGHAERALPTVVGVAPAQNAPPTPTKTPAPRARPLEAANTHTPSEWHVDEENELTGSGRALDGDPAATFLPAGEAAEVQRSAEAAWQREGEDDAKASAGKRAAVRAKARTSGGGRPWPSSLGLWLGSATLAVACAAYGGSLWRARTRAAANAQASDANAVATLVPRVDAEGEHRKDGPAEAVARGQKSFPSGVAPPPTTAMPRPIPQGQAGLDVVAPLPMAVTLGGHYLGDTPLFGVAVAPGVLHLKLESRQEGLVAWRKLRVPRGESRRVQVEGGRGRLLVEARPWAWVQRGLYPAGETPRDDELWAGDYVLTVECPDGRRRQQTVSVREHQTTRLQLHCD